MVPPFSKLEDKFVSRTSENFSLPVRFKPIHGVHENVQCVLSCTFLLLPWLTYSPTDTVGDLKKLIAAQTGTRADKIVLKKWSAFWLRCSWLSVIVSCAALHLVKLLFVSGECHMKRNLFWQWQLATNSMLCELNIVLQLVCVHFVPMLWTEMLYQNIVV